MVHFLKVPALRQNKFDFVFINNLNSIVETNVNQKIEINFIRDIRFN